VIGFNHIGTIGRFGNQMFQYAALKGIAANRKFEYTIPPENSQVQIDNYGLLEAFELTDNKNIGWIETENIIQEKHFHFDEDIFNKCPDKVSVYGFFQTEKYFKHIEDEVRKDFTFKSNCPVQPLEYYEKALAEFDESLPVVVFSDSIEWCKEQEFFQNDRFMFSEPEDTHSDGALVPYLDMCLMSLCDHAIIANSSMSWWGAWLIQNPNKKVIAPSMWFGSDYADKDTKDLYCENWKVI
jgi:hypothetical protein